MPVPTAKASAKTTVAKAKTPNALTHFIVHVITPRRARTTYARSWNGDVAVPSREQRHVDGGIIGDDPSLEDDTAGAGHLQPIADWRRRAGDRAQLAVGSVKRHEFSQVGE